MRHQGAKSPHGIAFRRSLPGSQILLMVLSMLLTTSTVWAYRPFESTDADVVDAKEFELEFGYFNWERAEGENAFITPQLVLNYGITNRLELVGEFEVEHPQGEGTKLIDPALFLKGILREGVLQDTGGVSIAMEAGLLFPSTVHEESRVGFEAIGIISGTISDLIWHLNLGGGVERIDNEPFSLWGVIAELSVTTNLRLVGEVNGESVRGEKPNNSGLLGLIWEPSSFPELTLDGGIRRGISRAAPDWGVTMGLSFSW